MVLATGQAMFRRRRAVGASTCTASGELSGIAASIGLTWATAAYDLTGNVTTIPVPSSPTSTYTAIYDARNRLVSLASGSTTVATCATTVATSESPSEFTSAACLIIASTPISISAAFHL